MSKDDVKTLLVGTAYLLAIVLVVLWISNELVPDRWRIESDHQAVLDAYRGAHPKRVNGGKL
jgi:hypothetical protein